MADDRQTIVVRQAQLREAGFRPNRHSAGVRLVRRLLWPFMRPFTYHLLDLHQELEGRLAAESAAQSMALEAQAARLTAQFAARLSALEARIGGLPAVEARAAELAARCEALGEESGGQAARILQQQQQLAALRAELEALAGWSVRTDDLQAVTLRQSAQRAELAALINRQVWLESAVEALPESHTRLVSRLEARLEARLEEAMHLQGAQQAAWDRKHRLFLSRTHDGIFVLKAGELISDMAARDGSWDAHILHAATAAAEAARRRTPDERPGRAVDAGAHFGLVSVALARRFDAVTSFEPNEFNASMLRTNVALNGLDGKVEIRRAALFSRRTQLSLAPSEEQEIPLPLDAQGGFDPLSASNLGAYSFTEAGSGMSSAPAYPLDDLDYDDLSFLKIDVQGADGEVLMGARETIRRCRTWLVFEWEDSLSQAFGVTLEQVTAQLQELDYVIRVLKRHNEKQIDYLAVPSSDAEQGDRLLGAALRDLVAGEA